MPKMVLNFYEMDPKSKYDLLIFITTLFQQNILCSLMHNIFVVLNVETKSEWACLLAYVTRS